MIKYRVSVELKYRTSDIIRYSARDVQALLIKSMFSHFGIVFSDQKKSNPSKIPGKGIKGGFLPTICVMHTSIQCIPLLVERDVRSMFSHLWGPVSIIPHEMCSPHSQRHESMDSGLCSI